MVLKASRDGGLGTTDRMTANRRASVRVQLRDQLKLCSYTDTQANRREWAGAPGEVKDVRSSEMAPFNSSLS